MTRKQRRSDETERRGLEVAVIETRLPNKPQLSPAELLEFFCGSEASAEAQGWLVLGEVGFHSLAATSVMVIP